MSEQSKRIILKISGESLGGGPAGIFDKDKAGHIASEIFDLRAENKDIEIAIVVGGGNIIRGSELIRKFPGFDKTSAHFMGMMATVMNGQFLETILRDWGLPVRLVSSIDTPSVAERYVYKKVRSHLEKKIIPILAGGTGATGCTTDTGAVIMACNLNASMVFKGTKVDGVYDRDPVKAAEQGENAELLHRLTYEEFGKRGLSGILDQVAVLNASAEKKPIIIFNIFKSGNLRRAIQGDWSFCTVIS